MNTWSEFDHAPRPGIRRHLTEEETLLVAVLQRALLDYASVMAFRSGGDSAPRDLHEMLDAVRWVDSREAHPFSFEYCCWQGLGEDPQRIRSTVTEHWERLLTGEAARIFKADLEP
jgi:hypothetical protein